MEKISNTHEIPYVKVRATEALVKLTQDEKIWEKKIDDDNYLVKSYAKLFTEGKFKF